MASLDEAATSKSLERLKFGIQIDFNLRTFFKEKNHDIPQRCQERPSSFIKKDMGDMATSKSDGRLSLSFHGLSNKYLPRHLEGPYSFLGGPGGLEKKVI